MKLCLIGVAYAAPNRYNNFITNLLFIPFFHFLGIAFGKFKLKCRPLVKSVYQKF